MSNTPFDPSKTYSNTNPFVEGHAPSPNSPIHSRQASPMKGVRSKATAPDGTEYSMHNEDFASEIGPDVSTATLHSLAGKLRRSAMGQ